MSLCTICQKNRVSHIIFEFNPSALVTIEDVYYKRETSPQVVKVEPDLSTTPLAECDHYMGAIMTKLEDKHKILGCTY